MRKLTLIYWESNHHLIGKLLEHPDIWADGDNLGELEENIKEAYLLMVMDNVPYDYKLKEIMI